MSRIVRFLEALPQLAGQQDGSGSTLHSFIYGNGPLAMIDSSGAYRYYTADQLGSIRATTGPAGGIRDRGSYQPFGEALANGGGAITNDGNPLAFTGQYVDPATGLYDMRARNYDSSTGRFLSLDPLGYRDAPQASAYGYARDNPTSFTDPSGMGASDDCGGIRGFFRCSDIINNTFNAFAACYGGGLAAVAPTGGAPLVIPGIGVIGEGVVATGGCLAGDALVIAGKSGLLAGLPPEVGPGPRVIPPGYIWVTPYWRNCTLVRGHLRSLPKVK